MCMTNNTLSEWGLAVVLFAGIFHVYRLYPRPEVDIGLRTLLGWLPPHLAFFPHHPVSNMVFQSDKQHPWPEVRPYDKQGVAVPGTKRPGQSGT